MNLKKQYFSVNKGQIRKPREIQRTKTKTTLSGKVKKPTHHSKGKKAPPSTATTSRNLNTNRRCTTGLIQCGDQQVFNHSCSFTKSKPELAIVFTDHIQGSLVNIIKEYARNRIIVGCVAWFSSRPVVEAIINSRVKDSYFVVNDENYKTWGRGCAGPLYESLPSSGRSFNQIWGKKIETPLNVLDATFQKSTVRAFGIRSYNSSESQDSRSDAPADDAEYKSASFSGWGGTRSFMHSKYLVICDDKDMPRWVWLGSMNLTGNSSNNIETCVFLDDPKIALHCFLDFSMTFKDSKPLRFK